MDPVDVKGDPVEALAVVRDPNLDVRAVGDSLCPPDKDLPIAVFQLLHGIFGGIPAVEVPDQGHFFRRRCPLPVVPAVSPLVEAVIKAAVCKIGKAAICGELFLRFPVKPHPQLQVRAVG